MKTPIYLDYAATTPVDPRVAEAMGNCLTMEGVFANPASRSHLFGWQAEEQVELARRQVADLLHCDSREIVWTSGATESNNLALKGVFELLGNSGQLITSATEHKAVIDPASWLQKKGVDVVWLAPQASGEISLESVQQAVNDNTRLVSVMLVNNETGVINPIAAIGDFCRQRDILLHVDAAQAVARVDVDVEQLQVDLMSLSAHKFYGPKGVGALYVRRAVQSRLAAIIHGGGHERGMRSGTLPTHQLVGMGLAAQICQQESAEERLRIAKLRDRFWDGIKNLPGVYRHGENAELSAGHLNVCFGGLDGEALLLSLRGLAVSSGSACTSASMEPSYVLKAMGVTDEDAHSSVRFSFGRYTQQRDIDAAIDQVIEVVGQLQDKVASAR